MNASLAGVFDAQPTASERQRENLSSRLRREFGLALPEDEEARPPSDAPPDGPPPGPPPYRAPVYNGLHGAADAPAAWPHRTA